MPRPIKCCLAFTVLLGLAGCMDSSKRLYRVTGTVLWQGKPLEVGVINVIAIDGQTAPASAKIVNGKFEVRTTAGMKTMSIYNQRDLGFNKAMNQNVFTNDVPAEYNANSTLRFEVAPHDDNVYDVSLPQDSPPKSGAKPSAPSSSAPQQK